jgi:hypothetical protein
MYAGEPAAREQAREEAAAWLADTSRQDDILFGYEPLYLDAREAGAPLGSVIVQRADPRLAIESLDEAPKPLGRGVWVFDASDQSDQSRVKLTIPETVPGPIFESRAWGPFLIIRTKEPVQNAEDFFRDTAAVELEGRILGVGDASINPADCGHCTQQVGRSLAGSFLAGFALERLGIAGSLLEGGEARRRLAVLGTARDAHPAGRDKPGRAPDDPTDHEGADPFRALALHLSDCRLLAPE